MLWAAVSLTLAATAGDVRAAALRTYIHGMTEEIAREEVGAQGVPQLLALLREPGFPRRDNVVAFLAFLGGPESAPALVAAVEEGAFAVGSPAEARARLLVPDALEVMARRGVVSAAAALEHFETTPSPEAPEGTGDPSSSAHAHAMGFANHVKLGVAAMNLDECDALMTEASVLLGFGGDTAADTACCAAMRRTGSGGTFGSMTDGLEIVDNEGELTRVLSVTTGRAKVVQLIRWCGEPAINVIGCANLADDSFVVVRLGNAAEEGLLWMHEYGHNLGLPHVSYDDANFMHPYLGGGGVRPNQCERFHAPPSGTHASLTRIGACPDDGDDWASPLDNCPVAANPDQSDTDGDRLGDACDPCVEDAGNDGDADGACAAADNCPATANSSQADFDADGFGDACEQGAILADSDLSGLVDGVDLARLGRAFSATTGDGRYDRRVDLDRDGQIDGADLATLASQFAKSSF